MQTPIPRRTIALLWLSVASVTHAQPVAKTKGAEQKLTAAPAADPVVRIRDEGLNRSEVMATLSHLTDIVGPRLTGSPELRRASEWARDRFTTWGLQNAALEPWGPFGPGVVAATVFRANRRAAGDPADCLSESLVAECGDSAARGRRDPRRH